MIKRGWTDEDYTVLVDNLKIGARLWQDKDSGKYYFGLRAYRRNITKKDSRS